MYIIFVAPCHGGNSEWWGQYLWFFWLMWGSVWPQSMWVCLPCTGEMVFRGLVWAVLDHGEERHVVEATSIEEVEFWFGSCFISLYWGQNMQNFRERQEAFLLCPLMYVHSSSGCHGVRVPPQGRGHCLVVLLLRVVCMEVRYDPSSCQPQILVTVNSGKFWS